MKELTCEYVRDVYPDVLNRAVDAETAAGIRAHLHACDECREEVEAVNAIFAGAVVAPEHLHATVMDRVTLPARSQRAPGGWRYAALAATAAAAVIGGSILWRATGPQGESAPPLVSGLDAAAVGAVTVEAALVSGKQSLQDLTVEELEQLLGEIES